MKNIALPAFIFLSIYGCTREVPFSDPNLQMIFKAFNSSDLDTIVLRKFKPADNYQHLIDTIKLVYDSTIYLRYNDTTAVYINDPMHGINAHYDWQINIPAINRTVNISDIISEQGTSECSTIMEPINCGCTNKIYSLRNDNLFIDLSSQNQYMVGYSVYINK